MRVGTWLKTQYPGLTNRQIEEALHAKLVTLLNGGRLKKGETISPGAVNCAPLDRHLKKLQEGNPALRIGILKTAEGWCAVDKPAGIPCNPIGLFDNHTVSQWGVSHFYNRIEGFERTQPKLCPHRLDTGTSGALIVCFTRKSYEQWRLRFQNREVKKKYLAWCWGVAEKKRWTVKFPIAKESGGSSKRVAIISEKQRHRAPVLEAHTEIQVMKQNADHFLAEIGMETGVTHQIRVHLFASGYPLIGDKLYDPDFQNRVITTEYHLLRATRIEVPGESIEAPSGIFESGAR